MLRPAAHRVRYVSARRRGQGSGASLRPPHSQFYYYSKDLPPAIHTWHKGRPSLPTVPSRAPTIYLESIPHRQSSEIYALGPVAAL